MRSIRPSQPGLPALSGFREGPARREGGKAPISNRYVTASSLCVLYVIPSVKKIAETCGARSHIVPFRLLFHDKTRCAPASTRSGSPYFLMAIILENTGFCNVFFYITRRAPRWPQRPPRWRSKRPPGYSGSA